jgi:carbon-monoxide dehydrogenase medium subunit
MISRLSFIRIPLAVINKNAVVERENPFISSGVRGIAGFIEVLYEGARSIRSGGDKMMSCLFSPGEYQRPGDIDEAIGLLSGFGDKARVIAGGTDILVRKPGDVECLVDISKLGLEYIREGEGGVRIGAATTVGMVRDSALFSSGPYRVLSEAAASLATPTIRNMATVGGNLCNASPAADLPLPLMVLDATLVAAGPEGRREIPVGDFFRDVNLTGLERGELLIEVRIPPWPEDAGASFMKLRRHQTAIDIAVVNVAALLICEKGVCKEARIAMGSVAPTPIRAGRAEALLKGKELDGEAVLGAAGAAAEETMPIDDLRASAAYRKRMVKVMTGKALESSVRRCGKCRE